MRRKHRIVFVALVANLLTLAPLSGLSCQGKRSSTIPIPNQQRSNSQIADDSLNRPLALFKPRLDPSRYLERASRSSTRAVQEPDPLPTRDSSRFDGSIRELLTRIANKYNLNVERFISIARCESGLNPSAFNRTGCEGYGCAGLFQHHLRYWPARAEAAGYPGASPYNAKVNAIAAARLAVSSGWDPWECA